MASDMPPCSPRFFVLEKLRGGPHDTEFSRSSSNLGPALRCPHCGETVGSLSWQPPYQGELELYGQGFGDLIQGPCGGLLITERFAEAFRTAGLTGLSGFHPIEVMRIRSKGRGSQPDPAPQYLFAIPSYGTPALDMERSRIRSPKPLTCMGCRYVSPDAIDGLALEAGTWNGEDVFRPRGLWGVIIVSERFMRLAEHHALSTMALVPIEKYVWDPLGLLEFRQAR
jgi:hypothetical protein